MREIKNPTLTIEIEIHKDFDWEYGGDELIYNIFIKMNGETNKQFQQDMYVGQFNSNNELEETIQSSSTTKGKFTIIDRVEVKRIKNAEIVIKILSYIGAILVGDKKFALLHSRHENKILKKFAVWILECRGVVNAEIIIKNRIIDITSTIMNHFELDELIQDIKKYNPEISIASKVLKFNGIDDIDEFYKFIDKFKLLTKEIEETKLNKDISKLREGGDL